MYSRIEDAIEEALDLLEQDPEMFEEWDENDDTMFSINVYLDANGDHYFKCFAGVGAENAGTNCTVADAMNWKDWYVDGWVIDEATGKSFDFLEYEESRHDNDFTDEA